MKRAGSRAQGAPKRGRHGPRADTNRDKSLRAHLQKLLEWEDAHVNFDVATDGIAAAFRGVAPAGLPYSPWQLIEHMRRTQRDILEFCRNPEYVEPSAEDYWPPSAAPPSNAAWEESIAAFRRDREELKQLAADPTVDLFERISHGTGQTYLRELLLVADHNAYHVAQVVAVRRCLGIWETS
jgi:DinB family protein